MKYSLDYDLTTGDVNDVIIEPDADEDPDMLNRLSKSLIIQNPASRFNDLVRSGIMNDMSDDDYNEAVRRVRILSDEVFMKAPGQNIFMVNAGLTKLFLNGAADKAQDFTATGKALTVQRFLDRNKLHGGNRRNFYEFISHEPYVFDPDDTASYLNVELEGSPMVHHIPKEDHTLYLFQGDKVHIITLYDATYSWLLEGNDEDTDFIDLELLLKSSGQVVEDKQEDILRDTVLLQKVSPMSSRSFLKLLSDKEIYLYTYSDTDGYECLISEGMLEPVRAAKATDGSELFVFRRLH